jgi:hypothetical protein
MRPDPEPALVAAAGAAWSERWKTPEMINFLRAVQSGALEENEDDAFEDIVSRVPDLGGTGAESQNVDVRWLQMRQIVQDAGVAGISPSGVCWEFNKKGIKVGPGEDLARETIQRWMSKDAEDGLMRVKNPATVNVRYFWAAAQSLRSTGTEG